VNTILEPSTADKYRVEQMEKMMVQVAERLRARKIPSPKVTFGRSNHEVGTLRMGETTSDMEKTKSVSATNANGKVHGLENLFVGDASVFPCVGVANPMLTITALAYRLAKHVGREMSLKVKKDLTAPWSLC
jgi:choline dehydrogenase-like flavoprotein